MRGCGRRERTGPRSPAGIAAGTSDARPAGRPRRIRTSVKAGLAAGKEQSVDQAVAGTVAAGTESGMVLDMRLSFATSLRAKRAAPWLLAERRVLRQGDDGGSAGAGASLHRQRSAVNAQGAPSCICTTLLACNSDDGSRCPRDAASTLHSESGASGARPCARAIRPHIASKVMPPSYHRGTPRCVCTSSQETRHEIVRHRPRSRPRRDHIGAE